MDNFLDNFSAGHINLYERASGAASWIPFYIDFRMAERRLRGDLPRFTTEKRTMKGRWGKRNWRTGWSGEKIEKIKPFAAILRAR